MNKALSRIFSFAVISAVLSTSSVVSADELQKKDIVPVSSNIKLETAGAFTSLQIGDSVRVFGDSQQLFQTKGPQQVGSLRDLFVLPYGPAQVPFILVKNDKNGLMVFSDLWPEFSKGKEKDIEEAYDSGRVFYTPQAKIVSKTAHHYAEQIGNEAVAFIANDFKDLKKGYHEAIRVKGKLRGLIIYDCCPYLVVENEKNELIVYHAGEKGAEQAGTIDL